MRVVRGLICCLWIALIGSFLIGSFLMGTVAGAQETDQLQQPEGAVQEHGRALGKYDGIFGKYGGVLVADETPVPEALATDGPQVETPTDAPQPLAPAAPLDLAFGYRHGAPYLNWAFPSATWYVQSEVLILHRDNRSNAQPLVFDTGSGATLLSTSDLTFGTSSAPRLLLGRQFSRALAMEVEYFGLLDLNATSVVSAVNTVAGAASLAIPGDLGLATTNFFNADLMTVNYTSYFNNAEANFVYGEGRLTLLGGFRYLRLNEALNINSINLATGTSDYRTLAHNNLIGAQTGLRWSGNFSPRVGWVITSKAGVFGNAASESSAVRDLNNSVLIRDAHTSGGSVAFIGDINASGTVRITDWLSARGGYNLLWVQGVALAPDQLDFTNTATSGTTLNHNGGLLLYGANAGLVARW